MLDPLSRAIASGQERHRIELKLFPSIVEEQSPDEVRRIRLQQDDAIGERAVCLGYY